MVKYNTRYTLYEMFGIFSMKYFFKIDDDENVADTVIVEIHADNEESFVDKCVTFTMYKIGESPGGD